MIGREMLRSIESNIRAFVKFTNSSERHVEIHWINFKGENIHYTNLDPGGSCMINTFCTHPWIFLCPLSGERLQVNRQEIFKPEAWFKFINKADNGLVSVGRQDAKIHFPLKSLRDACLWRLLFLVQSKNDVYNLEIPKTLRADLLHIFKQSTRFSENAEENEQPFGYDLDE